MRKKESEIHIVVSDDGSVSIDFSGRHLRKLLLNRVIKSLKVEHRHSIRNYRKKLIEKKGEENGQDRTGDRTGDRTEDGAGGTKSEGTGNDEKVRRTPEANKQSAESEQGRTGIRKTTSGTEVRRRAYEGSKSKGLAF